jgi:hypothetical protein
MRNMRKIAYLLAIVMSASFELCAQSASSAAQVVTFGVRRVVFGQMRDSGGASLTNAGALKITVGSQSQFQSALQFDPRSTAETSTSVPSMSGRGLDRQVSVVPSVGQILANQKPGAAKSAPPGKIFMTFTE